jgi:hypothetical protein
MRFLSLTSVALVMPMESRHSTDCETLSVQLLSSDSVSQGLYKKTKLRGFGPRTTAACWR